MEAHELRDSVFIKKIADYEMISAILWFLLALIQISCVVTIIAGAWNIYAAWTRYKMVDRITERDSSVPSCYEEMTTSLIIIGIINLFLGAVFGLFFVVLDFYIRDQVLKNKHVFTENTSLPAESPSILSTHEESCVPAFPRSESPIISNIDSITQLERLVKLYEKGILTDEEFRHEKLKIITPQ